MPFSNVLSLLIYFFYICINFCLFWELKLWTYFELMLYASGWGCVYVCVRFFFFFMPSV